MHLSVCVFKKSCSSPKLTKLIKILCLNLIQNLAGLVSNTCFSSSSGEYVKVVGQYAN